MTDVVTIRVNEWDEFDGPLVAEPPSNRSLAGNPSIEQHSASESAEHDSSMERQPHHESTASDSSKKDSLVGDFFVRDFQVMRPLLRYHSSYFKAALAPQGPFIENGAKVVEIKDNIKAFESLLCWIYTGSIENLAATSSLELCRIWVFADLRGIPGLADAVIGELHERTKKDCHIDIQTIIYILHHTMPGVGLHQFIYDLLKVTHTNLMLTKLCMKAESSDAKKFIKGFMTSQRIGARSSARNPTQCSLLRWANMGTCQWHQHV